MPGDIKVMIQKKEDFPQFDFLRLAVAAYTVILAGLNFIRIFDNNFWGDEAYTIRLSKMSFGEMLIETAQDVHPPLYYLIVQIMCKLFGYTGVVYHFASLLPYLLVLVFAMTLIWKRFGAEAAILLVTLASILENAVSYNVEVRMYSWGALFIMLSFWELHEILKTNTVKAYMLFVLFSLAGAYTHYYCLVSVAFFYLVLIVWMLYKRREFLKKTLIACVATVLLYLPWFIILIITFKRTMGDFWMTGIPYVKDCIAFFFQGKLSLVLFAIMLMTVFVAIWYQRKDMAKLAWYFAGLSSLFGTILVGNLMSRIFRPVFIVRYLYPVAVIAWLLLAVGISACKKKRLYTVILTVVLLAVGVPGYIATYQADRVQNILLEETLMATEQAMTEGNVILTDSQTIDWTVADYYYPDAECVLITADATLHLEEHKQYWLFVESPVSSEIMGQVERQGFSLQEIVAEGSLGTNQVSLYKLQKVD